MRCRALRGFYLAEVAIKKGDLVEVPHHLVRQLSLVGKIEAAPEPEPAPEHTPKPAKSPAKHAPMTTVSAAALVPGAPTTEEKETHHD